MSGADCTLKKHSIVVAGHQTSITLENIFWTQLGEIARAEGLSLNDLVARIDAGRKTNLSSAVRVFVLRTLLNDKDGPHRP